MKKNQDLIQAFAFSRLTFDEVKLIRIRCSKRISKAF